MSGNKNTDNGRQRNYWRIAGWGAAVALLLLPLIAMQFTGEVDWEVSDFAIFALMLAAVGGFFELTVSVSSSRPYRAAVGVALTTAFFLVWINAAVGIIGSEETPANLMFYGVLIVAVGGAIVGRCQPISMARTMVATALVQALIAVIAFISGLGYVFVITGVFVALWLTSAWLFKKAAMPENTNMKKPS